MQKNYAKKLCEVLKVAGLRAELDSGKEKVGYKIRQQTLQKVPFMVVVGANEVDSGQVNLRLLTGEQLHFSDVESALEYLLQACRPPDVMDPNKALEKSIQVLKTI